MPKLTIEKRAMLKRMHSDKAMNSTLRLKKMTEEQTVQVRRLAVLFVASFSFSLSSSLSLRANGLIASGRVLTPDSLSLSLCVLYRQCVKFYPVAVLPLLAVHPMFKLA